MDKEKITIEGQLRVKELLKERGMLMKDLAERIGIARESLTRALSGNPQYSTLRAIADELGVTVPELFESRYETVVTSICGFVKVGDEIIEVASKTDLENLLSRLQ